MSTMLATTNPEAVREIEGGNRDRRTPYEGQIVIFHMRPGEGRAGRMSAPAIVTRVEDEDHVELLVLFAADDFISRWKIPRRTEQNPHNAWAFNAHDAMHYDDKIPEGVATPVTPPAIDIETMYQEIGELRAQIAALRPPASSGTQEPAPHKKPKRPEIVKSESE